LNEANLLAAKILLFIADNTLKSLMVLALAGLIAACLAKASAATRNLLWLAALLSLLALPILAACIPSRAVKDVARIPATSQVRGASLSASSLVLAPADKGGAAQSVLTTAAQAVKAPNRGELACFALPIPPPRDYVWLAILAIWAAGVGATLVRQCAAVQQLGAASRELLPANGAMVEMANEVAIQIGLKRAFKIAQAGERSAIDVPMTWGFWHPVVALPRDAAQWPREQLRAALIHELAHVHRGDWLAQLASRFMCALYWFNPFVWLAAARLRQEGEKACDDCALTCGMSGPNYASSLLEIARMVGKRKTRMAAATSMASSPKLETRIRSILAANTGRGPTSSKVRTLAVFLAACIVLGFGLIRVVGGQQTSGQPSATVVATADHPIATLPNGTTVTLSGVAIAPEHERAIHLLPGGKRETVYGTDSPSNSNVMWWQADGDPEPAARLSGAGYFSDGPSGPVRRVLQIHLAYDLNKQPILTWAAGSQSPKNFLAYMPRLIPTGHGWSRTPSYYVDPTWTFSVAPGATRPITSLSYISYSESGSKDTLYIGAAFASADKTCTMKAVVAAGPWTWSTTLPNHIGDTRVQTPAGELLVTQITDPKSVYVGSGFKRGDLAIMVSDVALLDHPTIGKPRVGGVPTYDRRLLALDAQGRVVADLDGNMNPTYMGGDGSWIYNTHYLTPAQRKQIAELRLVMRPFQWAEFRGVQLYPKTPGV
jgi:beta-lactamase regulating signal transducer with metallopeptidase domain